MTNQPTQEAPSSDVVEADIPGIREHPCWHEGSRRTSHRVYIYRDGRPHFCERCSTRLVGGHGADSHNIKPGFPLLWGDGQATALASTAGDTLKAENERLKEALTPSGDTKAAYMGEFAFNIEDNLFDDDAQEFIEQSRKIYVPWTTIKEIMAFILARADARTALGSDQ